MNLYMTSQLATFENFIDTDTGEVDINSYNRSQIALHDKQLAVVCYLKNEVVRIDMLDSAIKDLTARKKAMQSRHDGLKDYLLVNMQAHGISEISAENMTFSAKIATNTPSVVIDDESLIPTEYMRMLPKPPPEADKTAIKDAIKAGIEVPGAYLQSTQRVNIK